MINKPIKPSKKLRNLVISIIAIVIVVGFMFTSVYVMFNYPPEYFVGFILLIPVLLIVFIPNREKQFRERAELLPTSKTRSAAMGEVELIGELKAIELMSSPIGGECIGYSYFVDKISKNNKGEFEYDTIETESKFNDFYLEDDVGLVLVKAHNIKLMHFLANHSYEQDGFRYSQITLYPNHKVLLIGDATPDDFGNTVISFGSKFSSKGITPTDALSFYELTKPLLKSIKMYGFALLLTIIFVVFLNTELHNSGIVLRKPFFSSQTFVDFIKDNEHPDYSQAGTIGVKLLMFLNVNPYLMVVFATFGSLLIICISIGVSKINKAVFNIGINRFTEVYGWSLGLLFIVGFVTQMGLLFMNVPGYKLFYIYLITITYCIVFTSKKINYFKQFSDSITDVVKRRSN